MKSGKWADDGKAETKVEGSFYEFGTLPAEKEEASPKMSRLISNVRDGLTNVEIIEDLPGFAFRIRDIDILRQTLLSERYAVENRDLTVTYIYGTTGTGKTRGIYTRHDPATSAGSPTTGRGGAYRLTITTGRTCLCLKNLTGKYPLRICSTS